METTTPATPIEEAAAIMRDEKIGALPVMYEGHMVGLITESDIFRAIVSLFSLPGKGVRITFDMSRDEDVFGLIGQMAQARHARGQPHFHRTGQPPGMWCAWPARTWINSSMTSGPPATSC